MLPKVLQVVDAKFPLLSLPEHVVVFPKVLHVVYANALDADSIIRTTKSSFFILFSFC